VNEPAAKSAYGRQRGDGSRPSGNTNATASGQAKKAGHSDESSAAQVPDFTAEWQQIREDLKRTDEPALRIGQTENAAYASKAALFDESIWLLWRMAKKN